MHTAKEAVERDAIIPEYYVMRRDRSMPATMAAYMPSKDYIANCKWFTLAECDVYGQEYTLSGWTGALHNYRRAFFPGSRLEMMTFAGRTIDAPTQIISGKQDWGANRGAGGPERPDSAASPNSWASIWSMAPVIGPHEEQPEIVSQLLTSFLNATA